MNHSPAIERGLFFGDPMNTDSLILTRIDQMAEAVSLMARALGTRITREQLAQRLGVHRNTLRNRMASDGAMPRPGSDGKWLLSEVLEWEQRRQ